VFPWFVVYIWGQCSGEVFMASDMCRPSVRDVRCAVSWCVKPIMGNYNHDFLLGGPNMGCLC